MASYAEKLKDPRWQKKRLEILNRDSFTCLCCGSTKKTLHIHHRYYLKVDPWDYPNDALDTLCESCHGYVESLKDPKSKYNNANLNVKLIDDFSWIEKTELDDLRRLSSMIIERINKEQPFDDGFDVSKPW